MRSVFIVNHIHQLKTEEVRKLTASLRMVKDGWQGTRAREEELEDEVVRVIASFFTPL